MILHPQTCTVFIMVSFSVKYYTSQFQHLEICFVLYTLQWWGHCGGLLFAAERQLSRLHQRRLHTCITGHFWLLLFGTTVLHEDCEYITEAMIHNLCGTFISMQETGCILEWLQGPSSNSLAVFWSPIFTDGESPLPQGPNTLLSLGAVHLLKHATSHISSVKEESISVISPSDNWTVMKLSFPT